MKRISLFVLAAVFAFGLTACGRKKAEDPIPDTTIDPNIVSPTILDPTLETNIPDSEVDTQMTDPTGQTDNTLPHSNDRMKTR